MTRSFRTAFVVTVVALSAALAAAQSEQSRISGRITDGSAGALPGVTVTITSIANRFQTIVTTAGNGDYETPPLQAGEYVVTFALSGFDTRSIPGVLLRTGEKLVLDQELSVAPLSETVEVTAPFPPPPPEPVRHSTSPTCETPARLLLRMARATKPRQTRSA